jgi:anaerobic magnesium-protoporphyrin IX monomethyl ester cyclase
MRLMLVYVSHRQFEDRCFILHKAQVADTGLQPPYTLMVVAAWAERHGHQVAILDSNAEEMTPREIVDRIRRFGPDVIGLSLATYNLHYYVKLARMVKESFSIPIVVGGRHLQYFPERTLHHPEFDYGLCGEAETNLHLFLEALEDSRPLDRVPGAVYRESGTVRAVPMEPLHEDISTLPHPARHLVNNKRYWNIFSRADFFTMTMASRGCPYNCYFCDVGKTRARFRSWEHIYEEMEQCRSVYGIREIDFQDSTFTLDMGMVEGLCRRLLDTKLDVHYVVRSRADKLDRATASLLARSGCHMVMFGIESGHPEVLKRANKRMDLASVKEAVRAARQAGMETVGFFIVGLPGDTTATVKHTLRFAQKLPLDYALFNRLMVLPNTEFYRQLQEKTGTTYWEDFVLDPKEATQPGMLDTELTEQQVKDLVALCWRRYYFRPGKLARLVLRIHTPLAFLRRVRIALDLIRNR